VPPKEKGRRQWGVDNGQQTETGGRAAHQLHARCRQWASHTPLPMLLGEHTLASHPSSASATEAPCSNASPPPSTAARLPSSTSRCPACTTSAAALLKAITPPPLPPAALDTTVVRAGRSGLPKVTLALV
jgi:hypothetical protein